MTTIRSIEQAEAASFRSLRLEALLGHPTAFGSSYEEAKATSMDVVRERLRCDDNGFVLGAYSNDGRQLVGMVGLKRETSIKSRHKSFIWGLYVTPGSRKQGVGRLLLEEAIARASLMEGLDMILLSVVTANKGASKLYRSLGFETYGTERCALKVDGLCVDEAHMAKRLGETGDAADNRRILEAALLSVKPGQTESFEISFRQASDIIAGMNGYLGHELRKCVENDHKYLLLVHWETLEDHTVGFRESLQYQEWRRLLHHYYDPFPIVEHYETNLLADEGHSSNSNH